jgi:hypothetical protein
MLRRVIRITIVAVLLGCVFAASPVYAKKHEPDVALHSLAAPGPQPALNESDYDAYRRPGTSTLSGHLTFPEPADSCYGQSVLLYPATDYTAWMLQSWAFQIDGRSWRGRVSPDDALTGIPVPPYLEESHRGVVSALQAGTCDKGDVIFSNVPAGRYYFVMAVQRAFRWYSPPSSDYAFVNGPEGIMAITIYRRLDEGDGMKRSDGYVLISTAIIEIKAGLQYEMVADTIKPVTHFLPAHP